MRVYGSKSANPYRAELKTKGKALLRYDFATQEELFLAVEECVKVAILSGYVVTFGSKDDLYEPAEDGEAVIWLWQLEHLTSETSTLFQQSPCYYWEWVCHTPKCGGGDWEEFDRWWAYRCYLRKQNMVRID